MDQLDQIRPVERQVRPKYAINLRMLALVTAASIGPALCLLFAVHYGKNVPFEDDWTVVPMINTALHGGIPFSALWQLHDQNRTLVPNAVFLVSGILTRDNLAVIVLLNALTISGAFVIYLRCFRVYNHGPLSVIFVVILSAIWFNPDGYFNILWAFQFAWCLIVLCLVAMIDALLVWPRTWTTVVIASAFAVVASFSSLQGLALWPAGLLCLIWALPRNLPSWPKAQLAHVAYWVVAAVGTAVASLWGYSSAQVSSGSPVSYSIHHPGKVAIFILEEIGEVAPNTKISSLWLNGILGTVLLAAAIGVIVVSFRHRTERASCLPVALICFGLLMDVMVALGRAEFSWTIPVPQYSQPNLLILLAVISFVLARTASRMDQPGVTGPRSAVRLPWPAVGLVAVLGIWVLYTTANGIDQAHQWDETRSTAARLVVNFNQVPADSRACYEFRGIFAYVLSEYTGINSVDIVEAKHDHLSVFSRSTRFPYVHQGLPVLPECRTVSSPRSSG